MIATSSIHPGQVRRSPWLSQILARQGGPRIWRIAVLGSLLALAQLAQAHETPEPYPRATLSAQASTEIQQDTVQVTLATEISGATQQQVSDQLNVQLDAAMKQAKGHHDIQVSSGSYRIWPASDRDGKIAEWRGRAEILLKSQDFNAASQLAAQMSPHLPIDGLVFSVSRELRATEEQKLMQQAVQAFRDRAQALTQALGFAGYHLYSLDLGGSGEVLYSAAPRMMGAMAADKIAAPLAPGEQTISVSVQGVIVLQPTNTNPTQSKSSE